MTTYTLKNEQPGARGVDDIVIDAGASRSGVELTDKQVALVKKHGYLTITEDAADGEKPLVRMNKAELLAAAEAANVTVAKDANDADIALADATNPQLVAAIEAARNAG